MNIVKKSVKDISPNDYNPNKIDKQKYQSLVENIKRFGYVQPILIDSNNVIIDGEHRFRACIEAGLNDIECVIWESDETTEEYKKLLTLSMNNLRGDNIEEKFAEVLQDISSKIEVDDISLLTGFDEDEINRVLKSGKYAEKEAIEDNVPDIPECLAIKTGDIIELGRHRLMCGDSTNREDIELLMVDKYANISFTSPPYNVGRNLGYNKESKYKNNSDNMCKYFDFLKQYTDNTLDFSEYSFNNIQMNANNKHDFINYLECFKNKLSDVLIWHKKTSLPELTRNVVNSDHEYIIVLSNKKKVNRAITTGDFMGTVSSVYYGHRQHNNENSDIHNATFPVEFPEHYISNFTQINGIVLDVFLGTGTTIIACEKTNRICYGMEIDRHYCSVIIQRYCDYTDTDKITINGKEVLWSEYKNSEVTTNAG